MMPEMKPWNPPIANNCKQLQTTCALYQLQHRIYRKWRQHPSSLLSLLLQWWTMMLPMSEPKKASGSASLVCFSKTGQCSLTVVYRQNMEWAPWNKQDLLEKGDKLCGIGSLSSALVYYREAKQRRNAFCQAFPFAKDQADCHFWWSMFRICHSPPLLYYLVGRLEQPFSMSLPRTLQIKPLFTFCFCSWV